MKEKTKKRLKIILIVCISLIFFAGSVLGVLCWGVAYTAKHWEYFRPTYEKINIDPLLKKQERTEEDYRTLYEQTGLTRLGIDGLLEDNNTYQIKRIQDAFFKDYEVYPDHFAAFTYIEEIQADIPFAALEDGDIIVSATTRVSWWRYGHAALVVDGEQGLIAESTSPGTISRITSITVFDSLANFMILRPNFSQEIKAEVVRYAKENLIGLPYDMFAGILSSKYSGQQPKGLQCAHLVWYAYRNFGMELDSTGGAVVKPQDMALSPHVELVQNFGFDLDKLWS